MENEATVFRRRNLVELPWQFIEFREVGKRCVRRGDLFFLESEFVGNRIYVPPRLRSSSVSTVDVKNLVQHRGVTSDRRLLAGLVTRPAQNITGGRSRNAFAQCRRKDRWVIGGAGEQLTPVDHVGRASPRAVLQLHWQGVFLSSSWFEARSGGQ